MITIFSEDHRLQDGKAELIDGKLVPCFEMPKRAEIVHARVKEVGLGPIEAPRTSDALRSCACTAPTSSPFRISL